MTDESSLGDAPDEDVGGSRSPAPLGLDWGEPTQPDEGAPAERADQLNGNDRDERAALAALAELVGPPVRRAESSRGDPPGGDRALAARSTPADPAVAEPDGGGLFTLAAAADDPPAGRGRSRRPPVQTRAEWWWRYGFPSLLALLVAAVPVLVWRGYGIVLESNKGTVVRVERQPDEPGWEAVVEPTQTLLLAHVDADGKLAAAVVLAQTGDTESGMLLIPPTTALTSPEDPSRFLTAEGAYGTNGISELADYVGATLNAALGETQVLESAQLVDLLGPAGSLTIDNDEAISAANGQRFPKGRLVLAPKDVPVYLSARNGKSDDLERMKRYRKVFAAWLDKIASSSDPGIVPGEAESGLGAFLRKLARTQVAIEPIPAEAATYQGATFYAPIRDQLDPVVVKLIPFAVGSPPGARPRVRVLDGTGQLDHGLGAVSLLVYGGAEVSTVGNAARFDYATTQIIYYDDSARDTADKLRDVLGIGEVVKSEQQGEVVDLTVILGTDWSELPIAKQKPPLVTNAPSVVGTTVKGGK